MLLGGHVLSHWARTQATVALSSGEAELNAALKGASECLALKSLLEEWGVEATIEMEGDSSAAKGTLTREGTGRQKHLSVRQLWLQEHVRAGDVHLSKIPREANAADSLTHHWGPGAHRHFRSLHFYTSPA